MKQNFTLNSESDHIVSQRPIACVNLVGVALRKMLVNAGDPARGRLDWRPADSA